MINPDDFTIFGHRFYVCDQSGITADSYQELLDKITWCHSVGIYKDRVPLQGYTIAMALINTEIKWHELYIKLNQ